MPGHSVIHVWCACGHVATIPQPPELGGLTRHQLLPRLKCAACGKRQAVDLRLGWTTESAPPAKP
jgi:hypothetical protein